MVVGIWYLQVNRAQEDETIEDCGEGALRGTLTLLTHNSSRVD
jgi:hypothetical protein